MSDVAETGLVSEVIRKGAADRSFSERYWPMRWHRQKTRAVDAEWQSPLLPIGARVVSKTDSYGFSPGHASKQWALRSEGSPYESDRVVVRLLPHRVEALSLKGSAEERKVLRRIAVRICLGPFNVRHVSGMACGMYLPLWAAAVTRLGTVGREALFVLGVSCRARRQGRPTGPGQRVAWG